MTRLAAARTTTSAPSRKTGRSLGVARSGSSARSRPSQGTWACKAPKCRVFGESKMASAPALSCFRQRCPVSHPDTRNGDSGRNRRWPTILDKVSCWVACSNSALRRFETLGCRVRCAECTGLIPVEGSRSWRLSPPRALPEVSCRAIPDCRWSVRTGLLLHRANLEESRFRCKINF